MNQDRRRPPLNHRDTILLLILGWFALGLARADTITSGTLLFDDGSAAAPLTSSADIEIVGMVAEVKLEQSFGNWTSQPRSGTYAFPLPPDAAVHRMTLDIDGRIIEGEIREKGDARRTYEAARREGRQAGLVDQAQPDLFTTSVANIPPGKQVRVTLHYAQTVPYRDGRFDLRFPMRITPGTDTAAESATVVPTALSISLEPGFELAHLASSYHQVGQVKRGARYEIELLDPPGDHDFELVWEPLLGSEPQAAFMAQSYQGETYGLLMLLPPQPQYRTLQPRELIVVIDTSGSMQGPSIEQARESLIMAIASLTDRDRFNVIAFDSDAVALQPSPVDATAMNIGKALSWIETLQADGGTNMGPALELALAGEAPRGFVRQVVFVTDGAVGNESALFSQIERELGDARLFTVGIGSSPNAWFMRKAAQFGRGSYSFVGATDEVAEKMDLLLQRLEYPVLTDVCVDWNGASETYPERIPDLYRGEPLIVAARLEGDGRQIRVCGQSDEQLWDEDVRFGPPSAGYAVATLWAQRRVDALMDQLVTGADRDLIRQEVTATALKHRLVSAYTSFVAVDRMPAAADFTAPQNLAAPLPQTDAGTVMRVTYGAMLLLLGLVFVRRLGDDQ